MGPFLQSINLVRLLLRSRFQPGVLYLQPVMMSHRDVTSHCCLWPVQNHNKTVIVYVKSMYLWHPVERMLCDVSLCCCCCCCKYFCTASSSCLMVVPEAAEADSASWSFWAVVSSSLSFSSKLLFRPLNRFSACRYWSSLSSSYRQKHNF